MNTSNESKNSFLTKGQNAGAYGGAGNQQGTTQGFGIHVIHPNVAVSVQTGGVSSYVNKRGQLAFSAGASGDKAGGWQYRNGNICT